jgi:hypothetical protein
MEAMLRNCLLPENIVSFRLERWGYTSSAEGAYVHPLIDTSDIFDVSDERVDAMNPGGCASALR